MRKINIFILAAGLGERLRPITNHIPKPLLPVLGKPVLERILEQMFSLPVNNIGMNLHYRGKMIQEWILNSQYSEKVQLFYENPMLGTAGALKNAESLLGGSAFLVHNADVISSISCSALMEKHLLAGNIATLAVHDYKKFNTVWVNRYGQFRHIGQTRPAGKEALQACAFTGIAAYSQEFLNLLPEGSSSIVDAWKKAVSSGHSVGVVDFSGCKWRDIGSPLSYFEAIHNRLIEEGEILYINPSVECKNLEAGAYCVIEKGAVIKGNACLKNCIVLPGAVVKQGSNVENSIVGPKYKIDINKSQIMLNKASELNLKNSNLSNIIKDFFNKASIALIGTGGSDRRYYRIQDKAKSAVLMECSRNDKDYQRHVVYTEFFRKHFVPVPELLKADSKNRCALFEDLGDISLYSWLKYRKDPAYIESLYRSVIDILVNLHTRATSYVSECPALKKRIFDYEHLRWETAYFTERFVSGLKGKKIRDITKLNEEFDRLARTVDSAGKSIIHRDFQSQNIMVTKGDVPRIIDYQGARIGPPGYDIASILWDPYFRLEEAMRGRLLKYYIEKMRDSLDNTFDEAGFRKSLIPCRLQRHMQAVGAYSFLSLAKGKTYFLKYIPLALKYLMEEAGFARNNYPSLHDLVKQLYDEENAYRL